MTDDRKPCQPAWTSLTCYTNLTLPFRIRWFVVRLRIRPRDVPWNKLSRDGEALHATPLRRHGRGLRPPAPHRNAVSLEDAWQAHAEGSCLNDITYRHLLPTCFIPTCRRHSASCGSSSPAAVRPRPRGRGSLLVPPFRLRQNGGTKQQQQDCSAEGEPHLVMDDRVLRVYDQNMRNSHVETVSHHQFTLVRNNVG